MFINFVACGEALSARRRNEHVLSEAGMAAGQGKLKRHDGSEVNAMAAKTSVNASLPSVPDKTYPSLGLCVTQAILEENPVFHIRERNNQRDVLLQRSACKLKRVRH